MTKTFKWLRPALVGFGVLTLLCGALYTLVVTGIAQIAFPAQANGSLISVTLADDTRQVIGSEQMAQTFTKPEYLVGRPVGVTNLSPTSEEWEALAQERVDWWHAFDPENQREIPMDLIASSGSGADPYISPAAAEYQVGRIANARQISPEEVRAAIQANTNGRFLGLFGEPAVHVLKVNLTLDGLL